MPKSKVQICQVKIQSSKATNHELSILTSPLIISRVFTIPVPTDRRINTREHLKIIDAHANNLKHLTLEIPLRRLVCLTGVSGSGKSTLLYDVLHKGLEHKLFGVQAQPTGHKDIFGSEYVGRVLVIDQSPIGRTPRSNPATYVGFWAHIRDLFSMTEEARKRGYGASRSFNVASISKGGKGGRCEACRYGCQVEMHFCPPWVNCDICNGKRFDAETLGAARVKIFTKF